MNLIHNAIICCYLYPITKYGYPPPAENTGRYLEEMKALGFQSVELEGIREGHLMEVYDRRVPIRETIESLGLSVPYFCVVLPGLSSADAATRTRNLELFEKGCQIAAYFGAQGVLDNAPLPPYQFPDEIPVVRHYHEDVLLAAGLSSRLDWGRYWKDLTATYQEACDIASKSGLSYLMHPAAGVLAATTDAFLYFRDAVGRDNLRFTLDTANQYFLKDNLQLSLRRLAHHIDYIHLSDNRGHRVEHLGPGDGNIDWDRFFETLDLIDFKGHIGLDIGGDESGVVDLDTTYVKAAGWLQEKWSFCSR